MIEVEGLTKLYGQFTAVQALSFVVRPGEVLGLVGANGAGKTTTLRCLAGIIPPTAGRVRVGGEDLVRHPLAAKARLAFVPDEPHLFDYLTVGQHLNFVARIYHVTDYRRRAAQLLEELELSPKVDALPTELSRGMRQKLAIACGFLHEPQVIFFDEPLTGLDPGGIRRMKAAIVRRAGAGAAVIISSHLLSMLEEVCTHVLILKEGQAVAAGTLAEIVGRYGPVAGAANGDAAPSGRGVNLEEVFFRATGQSEPAEPPADRGAAR